MAIQTSHSFCDLGLDDLGFCEFKLQSVSCCVERKAGEYLTLNAGNVCTKLLKDLVPIVLVVEPAAKFTSDDLSTSWKQGAALTDGIWALSLSR